MQLPCPGILCAENYKNVWNTFVNQKTVDWLTIFIYNPAHKLVVMLTNLWAALLYPETGVHPIFVYLRQVIKMSEIRDIWLHAHNMLRSARQLINKNLHSLDLSSSEANILLHLLTQSQEMGQEQLVEQLDVSKPAVSRALNSLETKGYVSRQRDLEDKRAYRIRLAEKALVNGAVIERVYNQVFSLAMRNISQDELDYFMSLLARISDNFTREQNNE